MLCDCSHRVQIKLLIYLHKCKRDFSTSGPVTHKQWIGSNVIHIHHGSCVFTSSPRYSERKQSFGSLNCKKCWLVLNKYSCLPLAWFPPAHHPNAFASLSPSIQRWATPSRPLTGSRLFTNVSCSPPLPPSPPLPFSTSAFSCVSSVRMYSRCITHVSRMTKLAAILTPHSAEWIGKYRAVEEWSIHPSAFTVSVFAERWLFLLQKCTLHLQRMLINLRWITTGGYGGARSGGRSGVKGKKQKKPRVETQQGGSKRSTGEAYLDEVRKLVLWSSYACGPTPCLALGSALKCSFVSQPYHTSVSHPCEHTPTQSKGTHDRSIKKLGKK